jgi:large-conductance mechanosensitive channel
VAAESIELLLLSALYSALKQTAVLPVLAYVDASSELATWTHALMLVEKNSVMSSGCMVQVVIDIIIIIVIIIIIIIIIIINNNNNNKCHRRPRNVFITPNTGINVVCIKFVTRMFDVRSLTYVSHVCSC